MERAKEEKNGTQMQAYIEEAERDLLHTYNRFPIVLERGEGVYLYDMEGKKYLDFAAGIAVFALGYGDKAYEEALKEQIGRLIHTSNYYYNVPAIEAARKLKAVSGMDRVFFTNSGAEAVEGAIKAAKKWYYNRHEKAEGAEIIAMEHSFHGRTMGALSVTGNPHYWEGFGPMPHTVRFARMNDLASVEALVNEKTCAVILETVQGEGGIFPADPAFLKGVHRLCKEKEILLILDEIQCGMGRTGSMFAWQQYGIKPDIFTTAKALGCGVPVGAFLMTEAVAAQSLQAGDHGTTYGGNPLAAAAVCKVLDLFEEYHIIENVKQVGAYLEEQLDRLAKKQETVRERRGMGLMQGLELTVPAGPIIRRALEKGLILINAGERVIRFVPPLVITEKEVDAMIAILDACLSGE